MNTDDMLGKVRMYRVLFLFLHSVHALYLQLSVDTKCSSGFDHKEKLLNRGVTVL